MKPSLKKPRESFLEGENRGNLFIDRVPQPSVDMGIQSVVI